MAIDYKPKSIKMNAKDSSLPLNELIRAALYKGMLMQ